MLFGDNFTYFDMSHGATERTREEAKKTAEAASMATAAGNIACVTALIAVGFTVVRWIAKD